jgi:hypothetical protein
MPEGKHFSTIREVAWETLRTYAIPLGLLGTAVKLWEVLPPAVGLGILLILPSYIVYEVNRHVLRRMKIERELRRKYESLTRLEPVSNQKRDNANRFAVVEKTVYITRPDAMEVIIEQGMNVSPSDHHTAIRIVASDSPTDASGVGCRAWLSVNGASDREVAPTCEVMDSGRRIIITVGFRGAIVRPSNLFRLKWQYSLPGSVSRNQDHWICGQQDSDFPVGVLRLKACFANCPADVQLSETLGRTVIPATGPVLETDGSGRTWHSFCADIEQARAEEYIWDWRFA